MNVRDLGRPAIKNLTVASVKKTEVGSCQAISRTFFLRWMADIRKRFGERESPESSSYTSVITLPIGGGMGHFETELSADTINGGPKLASGEK